jgi:exopolysaccharide production protein ExoZ
MRLDWTPAARKPLSLAESTRLLGLDALRAIAVALTFMMHFSWLYASAFFAVDLESVQANTAQPIEQLWVTVQYYSMYGVYFFFMISGLLIGRKWIGQNPPPFAPYVRDRAIRIFPAFWFALIMAGILAASQAATTFATANIIGNFTLLNWFAPHRYPPWLIVSWSLQIEWMFYLTVPLIALLLKRVGSNYRLGTLWAVTLIVTIALKPLGDRYFAYPAYFALGLSVAMYPTWATHVAQKIRIAPFAMALIAMQLSYAFTEAVGAAKLGWHIGAFDWFALLFMFIGGVIFLKIAFDPPPQITGSAMLHLGRISYSFYLWHLLVLICIFRALDAAQLLPHLRTWPWAARWTTLFVLCGIASALVSGVSYRLLERPYFAQRQR